MIGGINISRSIKKNCNYKIKKNNVTSYWAGINGMFSAVFIGHLPVRRKLIYYFKSDKKCKVKAHGSGEEGVEGKAEFMECLQTCNYRFLWHTELLPVW
jgi:hypothetical protein